MAFTVPIYVHPTAAIQAGFATLGDQEVVVDEACLERLSPAGRHELSSAVLSKQRVGAEPGDLQACAPTFDELHRLLEARAEQRRLREGAMAAREEQERTAALRAHEEAAERKHTDEVQAQQRAKMLRKWVEERGDESQQARFKEGLLPEEEALEGIHEDVFDDLETNERYTAIGVDEVCMCPCADLAERVNVPADKLTRDQHAHFMEIRDAAPKGTVSKARRHEGHCPGCDCAPVVRYSVELTLEWHGFTLKREYLL